MKAVFVCGPGRSGTTVLREALSQHPDVATMPGELRLIVDPGGLVDLYEALTRQWDPYNASEACLRWEHLMDKGYFARLLFKYLGRRPVPGEFLEYIGMHQEKGSWIGIGTEEDYMYRGCPATAKAHLFREFVEGLYLERRPEAAFFVDDTPSVGLHAARLAPIFPDRAFIHCVRHPMDILESHVHGGRTWTSGWPDTASHLINDVIRRTRNAVVSHRATTLKLEDVLEDPAMAMDKVCRLLRLRSGYEEVMAAVYDADKANVGRRRNLTPAQQDVAREILGPICDMLEYEVDG